MCNRIAAVLLLVLAAALLALAPPASGPAAAQEEDAAVATADAATAGFADVDKAITAARARADRTDATLQTDARDIDTLKQLQRELDKFRVNLLQLQERAVKPAIERGNSELSALGPPPADGDPPEAHEVAAARGRLENDLRRWEGAGKQIDALTVRFDDLSQRIGEARLRGLTARLTVRVSPVWSPEIWTNAPTEFFQVGSRLVLSGANLWLELFSPTGPIATSRGLLAALALAIVIGFPLRVWLLWRITPSQIGARPSMLRRLVAAALSTTVRAMLPIIATGGVYWLLRDRALFGTQTEGILDIAIIDFMLFMGISSLTLSSLSPRKPEWRLLPLTDWSAVRVAGHVIAIAATLFLGDFVFQALGVLDVTDDLRGLAGIVFAGAFATQLLLILPAGNWRLADDTGGVDMVGNRWSWRRVIWLSTLIAFTVLALGLSGYANGALFLASRYIVIGGGVVSMILIHYLVSEITATLFRRTDGEAAGAAAAAKAAGDAAGAPAETPSSGGLLQFWTVALVDTAAAIGLTLLIAPLFGAEWADIWSIIQRIGLGFEIGGVRLAPMNVAFAIGVFVLLVLLTRSVQRFTGETILPKTRLDRGAQDSIRASLGYLGFVISALAGVSTLGLDLANLAIVAGALSVGIGFGLQNIVNNFVSGLILLVERPIKVGDWINVGGIDGTVRKINVRATEIETFDRASYIVPNSDLISAAVTNVTHRNAIGRLIITVGAGYDSDPDEVIRILRKAAADNPRVLRFPEPIIVFSDFGASALNFELRVMLHDISNGLRVQTELRLAILKAFRAAGIEIPFAQQDIIIRNIDALNARLSAINPSSDPQMQPVVITQKT